MKLTVDEVIKNSFVLVSNDSEYTRFCTRMRTAGFTAMPKSVDATLTWSADMQSPHYALVRKAKEQGLPFVAIFTAEACPVVDCRKRLEALFSDGVPDGVGLLSLGNIHWVHEEMARPCSCLNGGDTTLADVTSDRRFGRIRTDQYGGHAFILFAAAYDEWMSGFAENRCPVDHYSKLVSQRFSTTCSFFIQYGDSGQSWLGWCSDAEHIESEVAPVARGSASTDRAFVADVVRSGSTGLCDMVAHVGRQGMCVVELGSYSGETAQTILDTGMVDKVYCVDEWRAKAAWAGGDAAAVEADFDKLVNADPRMVKVKCSFADAVARKLVPDHVDMVYISRLSDRSELADDVRIASGMCDILAGHHSSSPVLSAVIRDELGRGFDKTFSDTSWVVDSPAEKPPYPHALAELCRTAVEGRKGGVNTTCVMYATNGNAVDVSRLKGSLRSLLRFSKLPFDVVVVSDSPLDLSSEREGVEQHGQLFNVCGMDDTLRDMGLCRSDWHRQWAFASSFRLGLPVHPQFAQYDRALYLDTDTLVYDSRVDWLLAADLHGFEVGGVADIVLEESNQMKRLFNEDLPRDVAASLAKSSGSSVFARGYVNAGVLLFDLAEIRKNIDQYREHVKMYGTCIASGKMWYIDQDFVNACMRVFTGFSPAFNWFNMCHRPGHEPVIRHFAGSSHGDMDKEIVRLGYAG